MTIGGSLVCLLVPFLVERRMPASADAFSFGLAALPLLFWLLCFLCGVRGYSIAGTELRIHRLIWTSRFSLDELQSIDPQGQPFRGAVRLFGSPGIFAIAGYFYSRRLGRFRAYVTNPREACVLHFSSGSIVVSPGNRGQFLKVLLDSIECWPFPLGNEL